MSTHQIRFNQPRHHRWRDRPPILAATKRRPNFVIELRSQSNDQNTYNRHEIVTLMGKLESDPDDFFINETGIVAARFFYQQWPNALETIVYLWGALLDGCLAFTPTLVQNLLVPSDTEEFNSRLRVLFKKRVIGLMEGDSVMRLEKKLEEVNREIGRIGLLLKKPTRLAVHMELSKRKEGHVREGELIRRRIEEFKSGMECIIDYLDGKVFDDFKVLMLKGAFNWYKVYSIIKRECRRLDDGLPIYADRKDILWQIHSQQVMVLLGETGSGKSTQLVQFLADSAVAGDKAIVCTQPRKLAAMSLATRVEEESRGCLEENSVVFSSTYSSLHQLNSRVIYMTDHCLLQHYMNDKDFSWASCIIVDEAHERSLNTDLLLALLKDLLCRRPDLRLIIMSATADAQQLSKYFFGCFTYDVVGRTFPVDIIYVPEMSQFNSESTFVAPYVSHVLKRVGEIHRTEGPGTILAFLTSQVEVEWACEQFKAPLVVTLPLHGKLTHEEQYRVYFSYTDKRKVIFSTNLAETSLTIPGVKYVVDSGMVKESRFEPGTGMNVLRACKVSQSSANQRAGRAGRTEPGKCFRIYGENEFQSMLCHQEPEIRRVNLGIAVLRILALGIYNIKEFDFIDAPCNASIESALKNLILLGAVVVENGVHKLTKDGRMLVKLGIEPRLGKMILKSFEHRLGREGLVLAAVMTNSSSIFCRVGKDEEKQKSDCLKVQFCHPSGDLFTLLSVYRRWECVARDKRNQWCWDNSINAKSMRRCQEAVQEMESCLQHELNMIIPSYWRWNPEIKTEYDKILKDVILSALADNIAMYSGNDYLGYEVASTGTHFQLHPSCSLLMFGERPSWVTFGEIIAMPNQYLVCVTSVDFDSLQNISPAPFDISQIDTRKLQIKVLTGFGTTLLKRFCGKSNSSLKHLVSQIKDTVADDRVRVEVSVERNEVNLFASLEHMERVSEIVSSLLEREGKWLQNECFERRLFPGRHGAPPVALMGSGAEVKHLELEKRCLTVDIYVHGPHDIDEKELLSFLEKLASGEICAVHRLNGVVGQDNEKWGRITFLTPEAAEKATKLTPVDFSGCKLKIAPSRSGFGGDTNFSSFPAVKAKVSWPRRLNRGFAFVKCSPDDVSAMVNDFSNVFIKGKFISCRQSMKTTDTVMLVGLSVDVFEAELSEALHRSTNRGILDIYIPRGVAVENPPLVVLEEALLREVSSFMPSAAAGNSKNESVRVHIYPCEPNDYFMKADIFFDGSLHLEAAKALEQIDGKPLPGCKPWQKVECHQQFNSILSCPAHVYMVIKDQLHPLLNKLQHRKGVELHLDRNENGTYRVKLSAKATKIMAEARRPLEQLMNGKTITDDRLTPPVMQLYLSREGFSLQKSIQRETGTCFIIDKHNHTFRVFGPSHKLDQAHHKLVQSLVALHDHKQLDVHLRGPNFPPDFMKKVVQEFGPDLHGLKERFPGSEFTLNTRHHIISIRGSKELKQQVEETIHEIVKTATTSTSSQTPSCSICLCDVEDGYRLEKCNHEFCRSCLVEQCESAIRNLGNSFPIRCANEGCGAMMLAADLKSLLLTDKLDELFRSSIGSFVESSCGKYRFCPSPDCPSVYQVAEDGRPFACGACSVETCTRCHLEYHPFLSCERYAEFKREPDLSLKEWMKGKEDVKECPMCRFTIEKIEGCNHIECRCGIHICWVCLEHFKTSEECYAHLRNIHHAIGLI